MDSPSCLHPFTCTEPLQGASLRAFCVILLFFTFQFYHTNSLLPTFYQTVYTFMHSEHRFPPQSTTSDVVLYEHQP